jgi:hypothetical protein
LAQFFQRRARFSDADAGGLVIRLRLNGASSKSICGGSYRQSKMSFVFWEFSNGGRLSTFSTESTQSRLQWAGLGAVLFCWISLLRTSSNFAAASRAFTHTLNISMGSPSNSGMANVSAEQIRQLDYLHQDSAFRNALILQSTILGAPF